VDYHVKYLGFLSIRDDHEADSDDLHMPWRDIKDEDVDKRQVKQLEPSELVDQQRRLDDEFDLDVDEIDSMITIGMDDTTTTGTSAWYTASRKTASGPVA
jgi:hypothetical protein